MSNVGAWDAHYVDATERTGYGSMSYLSIAAFVDGCGDVEDWGCGLAALREYIAPPTRYRGIDGSASPFADVHADLTSYRSDVCAVVLRHVLEHNDEWAAVLDNAAASARDRLVIALFTPLADETHVVFREPDYGDVPVIRFRLGDILERLNGWWVTTRTLRSLDTAYGVETLIYARRRS